MCSSHEMHSTLLRLRKVGCPLDESLSMGPAIFQRGPSIIWDARHRGVGLWLDISLGWRGPGVLAIPDLDSIELWGPWGFWDVIWLTTPKASPNKRARSKGKPGAYHLLDGLEFAYDLVLNHHLEIGLRLKPGDGVAGLLLGVLTHPIPDGYADKDLIEAELFVSDVTGFQHAAGVKFAVDRADGAQARSQSGHGLFEPDDADSRVLTRVVAPTQSTEREAKSLSDDLRPGQQRVLTEVIKRDSVHLAGLGSVR